MTDIPSINPYPDTSQLSNVLPPDKGFSRGLSRLARGDHTDNIRIACSVSTFRGTFNKANDNRRRDSAKRLETSVSRVGDEGRWRDAIRHVALNRRGQWSRRCDKRDDRSGKPIHFPYS